MEHLYYEKDKIQKESAFVIQIENITSKESLLSEYAEKMHCSYFGKNWDALYECISDFSWIPQNNIIIIHCPLSDLAPDVKNVYIEIIVDSLIFNVNMMMEGKDVKNIDFVFDESDKDYIENYMSSYRKRKYD